MPKDYVGAYEKSLKTKSISVKALDVSYDEPPMPEHSETVTLWPTLRSPAPTVTKNKFRALGDFSSDDEDESEVLKALAALTPNVSKSSARSMSQRAKKGQPKTAQTPDFARLCAIARDVKAGRIHLPNVDLETNDEYNCLWALVDSGAGANVARKNHFPDAVPIDAPSITLSTASGGSLPNDGAHLVHTVHRDGTRIARKFYRAEVDMPILAVTEMAQEGNHGSEIRFHKNHGVVIDKETQRKQHFVKRRGVYFIKLYVPKTNNGTSGFTRPGP